MAELPVTVAAIGDKNGLTIQIFNVAINSTSGATESDDVRAGGGSDILDGDEGSDQMNDGVV